MDVAKWNMYTLKKWTASTLLARLFSMLFYLPPEYLNREIPASNSVSFTCIHTVGNQWKT